VRKHKNLLLLVAVLLVLMTQPLLAHAGAAAGFAYDLFMVLVGVAVLLAVFEERWERRLALVLASPAIALTIALYTLPLTPPAVVAYHLSIALFLGFAVVVIVRDLFRRDAIRFDELIGAFAGYLLLGIVWGSLYLFVEVLAPGSFSVKPEIRWQLDDWHLRRALFNYVSFATMAGLGYNDVTAVAPLANTLTWLEAMSAQFFLAVVIAHVVGMKLAQVVRGSPGSK
jgi:hypothetical protein